MLQAENIRSACCSRVVLSNCSLLAKQIFYFCSCSQKNRRHARECSQRPFVTQSLMITCDELLRTSAWEATGPWVRGVRKNFLFCIKMCKLSPFFSAFEGGFLGVPLYIFAHIHLHIYLVCARFIGSMIPRVFNT